MANFEIHIDRIACTGTGVCVEVAPQIFALDDTNCAVVVSPSEDEALLVEAALACPAYAIEILKDGVTII